MVNDSPSEQSICKLYVAFLTFLELPSSLMKQFRSSFDSELRFKVELFTFLKEASKSLRSVNKNLIPN